MAGAIRDGQTIRLVPVAAIAEGDVAMAALPDDRLVVHRVVGVDGDAIRLRGDSCWRSDPTVSRDAVIALVRPTPKPALRSLAYRLVPS
jgi:hypothetical protein